MSTQPLSQSASPVAESISEQLDTRGLCCPEPIMLLHRAIRRLAVGQQIVVLATDPSTERDIPKFCTHLGHQLVQHAQLQGEQGVEYHFIIQKTG